MFHPLDSKKLHQKQIKIRFQMQIFAIQINFPTNVFLLSPFVSLHRLFIYLTFMYLTSKDTNLRKITRQMMY